MRRSALSVCFGVALFLSSVPAQAARPQVDFLWVVDNSGSMSRYQETLSRNALRLFDRFRANPVLDWKMGLISTDVMEKPYLGFAAPFDAGTPEAGARFSEAVASMGIGGSADERSFDPALRALRIHPGFHRPGAHLILIFVTDAPEGSSVTAEEFLRGVGAVTGGVERVTSIGILGADDLGCPESEGWSYAGSAYERVILGTGGRVARICDSDWEPVFRKITDSFGSMDSGA